jgi:hypothetical protein
MVRDSQTENNVVYFIHILLLPYIGRGTFGMKEKEKEHENCSYIPSTNYRMRA